MSVWRTYSSMVLLVMIGLGLMIPSAIILGTIILTPYSGRAYPIEIGAGLYIASALMALASIPLINKRLTEGYALGILSCLLAFSTFIILLSLVVLGMGQYEYYNRYYQMVMLLIAIGGLALLPELIISILLTATWGESKRHQMAEKAKTTTETSH